MDAKPSFSITRILSYLLLSPLLFGCQRDPGAPVVIEFWAMGREGEVVQDLIPEFERRNPDIRVRVQQIPWSAAHEKLITAYAGDAMPDLFQLGNTWIPEFVALRAIEPLDQRIAASSAVVSEDYFAGILETNVVEDATYGVPWYVDTRLIFYRKDILTAAGFAQPPRTWAGWVEAMMRIKERAGADNYAMLVPLNEWELPVILALQRGAELLRDADRYGNFRADAFRDAFGFYLDLFRRGLAPRIGETQVANLYQEFANAYFSIYMSGPWNIGEFSRGLPIALSDQWATAPLPGFGREYPGTSIAGGASLVMFRDGAHKDAVWKLIEYLSQPAQQIAFYRLTGDLPPRKSAWRDAALIANRHASAFWTQLERVQATPKIPEWEHIASKIMQYAEAAVRGEMTEDEALVGLDREVDSLLEKRRWLMRESGRLDPPRDGIARRAGTSMALSGWQ